jgi:mono/diheme cytochrome c family protein
VRGRTAWVVAGALALAAGGCGQEKLTPEAERGRLVYTSQCTACHAFDPSQPGPVGPELKGSSRELLDAKVLHGTYPPGYKPKRPTAIMPPQTQVANDLPALAAYLAK